MNRTRGTGRYRRYAAPLAVAVLATLIAGCQERVVRDSFDSYRNMDWADRPPVADGDQPRSIQRDATARDDWSILIDSFEGRGARRQATGLMSRLRDESHLPDLWIAREGQRYRLLRGQYPQSTSPAAQRDLAQTRMVPLDGARPFAGVNLVRLGAFDAANSLDVRQHRGRWPYTLQVAVFDHPNAAHRQKEAQQLAAKLRKQGHQAFYYHGEMSKVTIGLFSDDDRVAETMVTPSGKKVVQYVYGPRIRQVQEQFPHNLVNGEVFYLEGPDGKKLPQPSSLIPIK